MNHDTLDDCLLSQPIDDVAMTTFHTADESLEDIAALLSGYLREVPLSTLLFVSESPVLTEQFLHQLKKAA